MDILVRLRVVFWACVIGLWGLFMYQYMSRDLAPAPPMRSVKNPFGGVPASGGEPKMTVIPPEVNPPVRTAARGMLAPLSGGLDIRRITAGEETPAERTSADLTEESDPIAEPPPGFAALETRHFVIYEEGMRVSPEIAGQVESLHGNIMLDLAGFSPWTRDKKVFVFFAAGQDTYQKLTGRPAWSGGVASLSERKIYLYKSEEAFGILAHELTHIYFDSFFPARRPSPLWLSEGLATYIQSERGYSTPNWLARNLRLLENGGGFKLTDLVRIDTMQDADEENVRLWYAQAYSVVRFLMRMKAGDAFYVFCKNLRDGIPEHRALFQAYGMPYNKLSSLEYAWRHDLKTGKIATAPR